MVQALRGVSLSVSHGEFVAIMGPSGSGKSTFMHLLGCLDRPTSGSYVLAGQEVSGLTRDQLAAIRCPADRLRLSKLQSPGANERPGERGAAHALRRSPAEDARRARTRNPGAGGARAAHGPPAESSSPAASSSASPLLGPLPTALRSLMADEPTGNLDSASSVEIMTLFRHLNRDNGITIIVVTHATDVAAWTDRVVTFRDGLIIDDRPAREVTS